MALSSNSSAKQREAASFDAANDPGRDETALDRLRELQLELEQTRSEAAAARLDARAAELERRIQRLEREVAETRGMVESRIVESAHDQSVPLPATPRGRSVRPATTFQSKIQTTNSPVKQDGHDSTAATQRPNERIDASHRLGARESHRAVAARAEISARVESSTSLESWDDVGRLLRADQPAASPDTADKESTVTTGLSKSQKKSKRSKSERSESSTTNKKNASKNAIGKPLSDPAPQWALKETEVEPKSIRRRMPAWLTSLAVHSVLVVLLALMSLSATEPRDQVAIAASMAQSEVSEIETIQLETESVETAETVPVPTEVPDDLSEFGELPVTELVSDLLPKVAAPLPALSNAMSAAEMATAMSSDSSEAMEFCGIQGGGNHFVYLVDSSKSMGDGFAQARQELLRSIELLTPKQKFYVIFFDEEPAYMRISDPNVDESRSVYATPANKAALGQWAMSISMDGGKAPYEILPFAFELRPDVIFLLSDGEFPKRIEQQFKDLNRVDSLFGDDQPISLVHTIGYHSRAGENGMRRIATQAGGNYRYVPKP
ncbi:hypothetical protein [Rhodopirellula sp. MGV]|uniref:hypothetical protein n=1 Tax=Rhodopirellula sp. MGV TaxID=2023130 RepID=UPI000B964693|nr:hypothetical protein [Rhodopirellula sp. MGV]OYP32263.1 hypothetical protein CGZ80_19525 [Rhodopirellula sp. MGV]PNY35954.1 hypothetical protein C2E31_15955 [Rhodopirellula baltica]